MFPGPVIDPSYCDDGINTNCVPVRASFVPESCPMIADYKYGIYRVPGAITIISAAKYSMCVRPFFSHTLNIWYNFFFFLLGRRTTMARHREHAQWTWKMNPDNWVKVARNPPLCNRNRKSSPAIFFFFFPPSLLNNIIIVTRAENQTYNNFLILNISYCVVLIATVRGPVRLQLAASAANRSAAVCENS